MQRVVGGGRRSCISKRKTSRQTGNGKPELPAPEHTLKPAGSADDHPGTCLFKLVASLAIPLPCHIPPVPVQPLLEPVPPPPLPPGTRCAAPFIPPPPLGAQLIRKVSVWVTLLRSANPLPLAPRTPYAPAPSPFLVNIRGNIFHV